MWRHPRKASAVSKMVTGTRSVVLSKLEFQIVDAGRCEIARVAR